jgi:hypothetical protein
VKLEDGDFDTVSRIMVSFSSIERPRSIAGSQMKDRGSFQFRLDAAPYQIAVTNLPPGLYVKSIRFGAEDADNGLIRATPGAGPLAIVLASGTGEVRGSVQTAGADPVPGARVLIASTGARAPRMDLLRSGISSSDGSFVLKNLAPGEYRIFASMENLQNAAGAVLFRDALAGESVAVSLRSGALETVQLKPVSAETLRAARSILP